MKPSKDAIERAAWAYLKTTRDLPDSDRQFIAAELWRGTCGGIEAALAAAMEHRPNGEVAGFGMMCDFRDTRYYGLVELEP